MNRPRPWQPQLAEFARDAQRVATILCLAGSFAIHAPVALGFATWGPGSKPTDLVAEPQNFSSLQGDVWTWKMTDEFRAVYNTQLLQDQIRLAVKEWETAFNRWERKTSNRWDWTRNNGDQPFFDLQSIAVHELGHALGFQHADAAYFNINGDTPGQPYLRNYRLDAQGNPYVAAPIGGEVMNEGNDADSLPNAKPPKGIPGGAYWRTLSRDEVAGIEYVYGRPVTFVEVGPDDDALISFNLLNEEAQFPSSDLGSAGPDASVPRDPGDPLQGKWITATSVGITAFTSRPVGILPRASSWTFTNGTGTPLTQISIRSEGTSNGAPLLVHSSGGNAFTDYEQSSAFLLHEFENRGHLFQQPNGGAVAPNATVDFGLTLDVWDWTVERATALSAEGEPIPLPVIALHDWNHGGFEFEEPTEDAAPPSGFADDHHHHDHGLSTVTQEFHVAARGFRIVAGDARLSLEEVGFASVAGRGLGLAGLNPTTLAALADAGDLVRLPWEPVAIDSHQSLTVVLQGLVDDLPAELQQSGDFRLANDPRWSDAYAKGEILLYGRSRGAAGEVTSFSLINGAPIAGRPHPVPEPSAVALLAAGVVAATIRRWRRPDARVIVRR